MKERKNRFYRFVIANTSFLANVFGFLILVGVAWFIYFTFIDKTNNQDQILAEIRSNQAGIISLRSEVEEQRKTIEQLSRNVCTLQQQIVSAGLVPSVEIDPTCPIVVIHD